MKTKIVHLAVLALLAAVPLAACGSSKPSASNGSSGGSSGSSGNTVDGGAQPAPTAGQDAAPALETCKGVPRSGAIVESLVSAGPAPQPRGGTLVDGTYVLTKVFLYSGAAGPNDDTAPPPQLPPPVQVQATALVVSGALKVVHGKGSIANGRYSDEETLAAWYKIEGTTLALEGICPSRETRRVAFSTDPGVIMLYATDKLIEVYTATK